jgi:heavy metal translocating P-type ATPase
MWCASCGWLIGEKLGRTPGVESADVSFASDTARITYSPARLGEDDLITVIKSLGYGAAPLTSADEGRMKERRRDLARMGVALLFAMNVMMFNFIIYAGYWTPMTPGIGRIVPWILFVLSLPVVGCALPVFNRALRAALHGAATMDTLISIGSLTAFLYSFYGLLSGVTHTLYFDTADMLLALVLAGKFIEHEMRSGASNAITTLYGLLPRKATVLVDNRERAVAIAQLAVGDIVIVRAGERVSADGVIRTGIGQVDESLLTGEAEPVAKRAGDAVTGGTILTDGSVQVCVSRVGDKTTVAQMLSVVEQALSRRSTVEDWADRVSRVFVPLVLALALGTVAYMVFGEHAPLAAVVNRAVAVLVIACPCALAIATPMAISAAVGSAAQIGVLISDPSVLEPLSRLDVLVLDKTGTLTDGRFAVREIFGDETGITSVASLEALSEHPIGRAIGSKYPQRVPVSDFVRVDGAGVYGKIDGRSLFVGSERMALLMESRIPDDLKATARAEANHGRSVVFFGTQHGAVQGVISLGDALRPGAVEAVSELAKMGVTCEIVSGDAERTVAAIAKAADIKKFWAGVTALEKAAFIDERRKSMRKRGTLGMVGDGINDAAALATADLGVAMASGAEIASRAAQITLLSLDLTRLPRLIRMARKTVTVTYQNLFWALAYNLICIPLAVCGFFKDPILAAGAMLISSATVILNSRRLSFLARLQR